MMNSWWLARACGRRTCPRSQAFDSQRADVRSVTHARRSAVEFMTCHSERVRVYADLLHDIGKLSVDPTILNKPRKPSEREWNIPKAYPEQGARAASALLSWLVEWGRAIIEHHEKFDGSGYPKGLTGTKISQAGRLIGVVDAFEVMTAARSYKRPMSALKAREELARCAGAHFDPVMVRALLAISLPRLLWATGPLSFFVQLPSSGQRATSVCRCWRPRHRLWPLLPQGP
jgi:response regulator RpfG family c-di-GMP phosphodiesterase